MEKLVGQAVVSKSKLLEIAGVYENFIRGEGDLITWQHEDECIEVLDLVGGFGSTLLGHNHPEIIDAAMNCISSRLPIHVQGSLRTQSQSLKKCLSQILREQTNKDYVIMLLNTGTEAVEAAIKHAEYEYALRIQRAADKFTENLRHLEQKIAYGEIQLDEEFYRDCEIKLNQEPIEDRDSLFAALAQYNTSVFNKKPAIATYKGDFHGKTKGSLAFTWNRDARLPFIRNHNDEAIFVQDAEQFASKLDTLTLHYYTFDFDSKKLIANPLCKLAAFIYEPIQGEGGIRPLNQSQHALLAKIAEQLPEAAIIADEIQCGLGRTGSFLESAQQGLPNNYITLAKSLGGSFAKISALAVERSRFRDEFDLLHSSTFSDDPISSTVAQKTLEIIQRDNIPERCHQVGETLIHALNQVKIDHPDIFAEIRGKGCMIGVEIANQEANASGTISALYNSKMLTMVMAGYFLHRHHIRILPSLGNRNVLRIQPSAYLSPTQFPKIVGAFSEIAKIIKAGNAGRLLSYMIGPDNSVDDPERIVHPLRVSQDAAEGAIKVGFISHFIDKASLREIDPSLDCFDEYELEELNDKILPVVEAQTIARRTVKSPLGSKVELILYGIQMDAETIETDMSFNKSKSTRNLVADAYYSAREEGCSLVGFGGYTSIVSNNCTQFSHSTPSVTSGNALTVASSMATIIAQANAKGIAMSQSTVAILGATGNIGEVHSRLLAEQCGKIILIGRAGSQNRLMNLVGMIVADFMQMHDNVDCGALAMKVMTYVNQHPVNQLSTEAIVQFCLDNDLIQIAEDMEAIGQADIVVTATNASKPILLPHHFSKSKTVLVNDVAVPRDVDERVGKECSNVHVMRGGLVYLTNNPEFTLPGMLLEPGYIYACAAETILLGLAGIRSDFSVGAITPQRVKEVSKLAQMHGYKIDVEKTINVF